ncbi:glycosyltransferase family 1 protein [Pullulanibacillus sp. KACC 23026]|uniref:glycosyltransferase family 1 protein n=1 Tax=Pullulanibacillus sp. KACC 23026 TaxID=3028315 RepID=UPI0023B002FA|nr:glycosyltransferase family 1 protein [Pullulanibacillus sp. KACC 23026]WEG11520.1 glycosyltransferase family 1 protein [Pullulanibacillus sp. KACC 23026]
MEKTALRVLQVVVNMNRGGAETLLMNLYRHIDRSKIQFDFLICNPGVYDKEIKELGGHIFRIPYVTKVGPVNYQKELRAFFNQHAHYLIVHSHLDKMSGLVLKEAYNAGIPIRIAHSHNTSSEGNWLVKGYKWLVGRFIPKFASHYFACSQEASNWLFKVHSTQTSIIKNGINLKTFQFSDAIKKEMKMKQQLGDSNPFVIGHIGRFNKQKNHHYLIDIFNEVVKHHSHSLLVLVGEGSLKLQIENKVHELGLENQVIFMGVREDVHKVLHLFDVLIYPSFHEGLPLTLIEAQAVGVPCLVSERITREVDLGLGLMNYKSLNEAPSMWALKSLTLKRLSNSNETLKIKKAGYDIQDSANWLENYYVLEAERIVNETISEQVQSVNL